MTIKSIRILGEITSPGDEPTVLRLWDGAGPYLDADGNIWGGCRLVGLDQIEMALNGEASEISFGVTASKDDWLSDLYSKLEAGQIAGSRVRIMIQDCDEYDQPVGDPQVRFTGTVSNVPIKTAAQGEQQAITVIYTIVNRFNLRNLINGAVLSDVDQRARSAVLNPDLPPDRFCERIPGLADKTIVWPRFTT